MSLNSPGLTPTAASTAVPAASGVWLRRVLLAVAAFETLRGFLDLYAFDLHDATLSFGQFVINARLFIHPFFAFAALVLAAHWYLHAAVVVLAANILATLAIGWSPLGPAAELAGVSVLAQQVIFGPLAVTAIVLAILDKLLWLSVLFVALPSAILLLPLSYFILFAIVFGIALIISGGGR